MTQQNINDDLGPSFTAAKFLCHRAEEPTEEAFMRVYLQVPIVGTELQSSKMRAKPAAPPRRHAELPASKTFIEMACDVVPALLCYE
ncbi:hypothetical protein N7492_003064 [Penicillium capsulatum]|uniref:Uncharacterized protein n=1 Tax=Penicillium capsulatum TaxID=69766 RepID=A0A9W9IL86_9EURO|nr:hypothetical protein N7492_003064 [Penicillium capsulatum]KAJ6122345.1 hypothetical protein N7512_004810 [Penicillium capsulatum]